jgi:hypothetical protein
MLLAMRSGNSMLAFRLGWGGAVLQANGLQRDFANRD